MSRKSSKFDILYENRDYTANNDGNEREKEDFRYKYESPATPPPLPCIPPGLFSLNRSSSGNIRNATITPTATASKNNNNAAVTRGIINRSKLNLKSILKAHEMKKKNGQQLQQQQQSHYLSHGVFNEGNRRIDFSNNNQDCLLAPPPPHARHIMKREDDDDNVVRCNRSFPPPPSSLLSVNNSSSSSCSSTADHSLLDGSGILLETQRLDSFLDLYEHKYGLEPLDSSEVQGLSSKLDVASLLLMPPQQQQQQQQQKKTANNADEHQEEWHTKKKSVQTFLEKDLQKEKELIASRSHPSSSDLSLLLAATLSDDDIQDKNLSNNNSSSDNNAKDFKNISVRKREPLSPIKEESDSEDIIERAVVRNAAKDSYQNNRNIQTGIKDISACNTKPGTKTLINTNNRVEDVSNAEVEVGKSSFAAAKKKTSNSKRDASPPPRQQQPQHIENSKIDVAIGRRPGENNTPKENTAPTVKSLQKSVIQGAIVSSQSSQSPLPSSPSSTPSTTPVPPSPPPRRNTVAQHHHISVPQKSKIPLPLQKAKANSQTKIEEVAKPVFPSKSILSKIDSNINNNNNTGQKQVQVQKKSVTEKVGVDGETKSKNDKSNNLCKLLPSKKGSPLPQSHIPIPAGPTPVVTTEALPTTSCNKDPLKLTPLKSLPSSSSSKMKIGAGDQVLECLGLIDGLSGHTSWVMNKLLEYPSTNAEAIKRIKKLQQTVDVGDFFGVPYISNDILTSMHFSKLANLGIM